MARTKPLSLHKTYLPDDGIIDTIAVEKAVAGSNVNLTRPEAREVVAQLARLGIGDRQIARRMGIADKTAKAWRELAGVGPNVISTKQELDLW